MTKKETKNIAASIHAKLTNKAKANKLDVNILRTRYALERFLYRLSLSDYKEKFTLKGAMLFLLWSDENFRPTKDSDFLLTGDSSIKHVEKMIKEICDVPFPEDDALVFDQDSVSVERIKEDQQYSGLRVTLKASLSKIPIPIQLDIGTGDIVTPEPEHTAFPTILDNLPAPILSVYSRETVIAEKLEAMVSLDLANSRMKDFYDIWTITEKLGFDSNILIKAIAATFERRETEFPSGGIPSLTPYFYNNENKIIQWKAFLKKGRVLYPELTLQQVCEDINKSLSDVFKSVQ